MGVVEGRNAIAKISFHKCNVNSLAYRNAYSVLGQLVIRDLQRMVNETPTSRSRMGSREPVLHHYTNFHGLAGIVASKSLWCTKMHYMNDASELKDGLRVLKYECRIRLGTDPLANQIANVCERYERISIYVCSFSEAEDTLSQWRGYAGVSISFPFSKLNQQAEANGYLLSKCIYDEVEKRAVTRRFLEHSLAGYRRGRGSAENIAWATVGSVLSTAARFKNSRFSEEKEWRLVSQIVPVLPGKAKVRSTNTGLIPYAEFNLAPGNQPLLNDLQPWRTNEDICIEEVMIGPNHDQELQMSSVGELFESHNAYVGGVGRSSIPFRLA